MVAEIACLGNRSNFDYEPFRRYTHGRSVPSRAQAGTVELRTSRTAHALVNSGPKRLRIFATVLVVGMTLTAPAYGESPAAPHGAGSPALAVPGPSREVLVFDRFIAHSAPVCLYRPAAVCVDVGWAFADVNGDEGLSVDELVDLRDGLRGWAVWRSDDLYPTERSLMMLGFFVVDGLGVENLHRLYDEDGDGVVSREELLADVTLDDRPLGEVLLDRESVDRAAIAARLGVPPTILERIRP